jgi:hypothetical protein
LTRLGYDVQVCLADFGETAEAVVRSQLKQKRFDCVLIGAGIHTIPSKFLLFEKLSTSRMHTLLMPGCASTRSRAIRRRQYGVGSEAEAAVIE